MGAIYAATYTGRSGEMLVKVGFTIRSAEERVAEINGYPWRSGVWPTAQNTKRLLWVVANDVDARDKLRTRGGLEQEVVALVDDVGLLCPDERDGEGRIEMFYARLENWTAVRERLLRPDVSPGTAGFQRPGGRLRP